jgi:integrase
MATITKRVTGKGEVRYRVQVRLQGYPKRHATFNTKKDATDWARDIEGQQKRGRIWAGEPDRTFRELLDRFEKERQTDLPAVDHGYRGHLRWWRQELGDYHLRHITVALVSEAKEKLLRDPGPKGSRSGATVNRYLTTLSTVLTLGTRLEWLEQNVARRVEHEQEPDGRVRFLSRPVDERDCELDRLLAACKESVCADLSDLVVLGLHTGCRASELLQLRAAYIRLSVGGFTLPAEIAKNGISRFVPLVGEALEIVERRLQQLQPGSDLLFPGPGDEPRPFPRYWWDKALESAGIEDFRFHDLRHTHASYLAMLDASAIELKETLGHKTLAMVARYTHLANLHKSKVAARLTGGLEGWRQEAEAGESLSQVP